MTKLYLAPEQFSPDKLICLQTSYRGTDAFSLAVSKDNINFETVVMGNLPDARNKKCGPDIPLIEFEIHKEARFIKVTLISRFGYAAGLQYINFVKA